MFLRHSLKGGNHCLFPEGSEGRSSACSLPITVRAQPRQPNSDLQKVYIFHLRCSLSELVMKDGMETMSFADALFM